MIQRFSIIHEIILTCCTQKQGIQGVQHLPNRPNLHRANHQDRHYAGMERSPWKLTVTQLVKKFPALYGTRTFITVLTRAR